MEPNQIPSLEKGVLWDKEKGLGGIMERHLFTKAGLIEVICGPMFSGKTEELIRRLRRAKIARQRVVVFKPRIDNRYDEVQIVSHSSQKIPSIPVEDTSAMQHCLTQLDSPVDVVGVDEAQFFDASLLEFVDDLANKGTRVVIAGLDQDYLGRPFGAMPNLLAIADVVTKQYAVCVMCGSPASKSQRVATEKAGEVSDRQVLVGAEQLYEARCRRCHRHEIDKPVTHRVDLNVS
jgi:thymidine kinase